MTRTICAAGIAALTALAGCDDTATDVARTPTVAEQSCLLAVTNETNNPDVTLLGSEFSEAGTFVRVGVGQDRAPWQCIAYADGSTGGVMFTGDEGAA